MNRFVTIISYTILIFTLIGAITALAQDEGDPEFTYVLQEGIFGTTEDATLSVDSRLEKHNLGGTQQIDIWQYGGVALIRFDLSGMPKEAEIKAATLELYSKSAGFADEEVARDWPINVSEFLHAWAEGAGTTEAANQSGTTITTSDGKNPWPDGSVMKSAGKLLATTNHQGGEMKWYQWTLDPKLIAKWIATPDKNSGLVIWGEAPGKAVAFTSSESSTTENRPKLRITTSIPVKKMIDNALGTGEPRPGVKRVRKVETFFNPENERITINVDWSTKSSPFWLRSTQMDVEQLLKVASRLGPALSHLDIRGYSEMIDKFGNTSEVMVVNAFYSHETVGKINWKNFLTPNVFTIADTIEMHPELKALDK